VEIKVQGEGEEEGEVAEAEWITPLWQSE